MTQPEPLMAAPRDATCYDHPGTAYVLHIATADWLGTCTRNPLAEFAAQPAAEVPALLRCQRPGCRVRWPKS